jgi:hypothetical protein
VEEGKGAEGKGMKKGKEEGTGRRERKKGKEGSPRE